MATQRLRRRLVKHLVDEDVLHDPKWVEAFRGVPRHVFLPQFFTRVDEGWAAVDRDDPGWLERVYSPDVLVTQLDDDSSLWDKARREGPIDGVPTSSSSMPAIMAIMLEELRVEDRQRVLEIGTGTGYNAALLSHRCGSGSVSTVDVDAGLVSAARGHLQEAGYAPSCEVGDGALGFPAGVLFDRVLCTASVSSVPPAWLEQTVPGGLVVTTLNRPLGAGLVRLVAGSGATGHGRVLARDGRFMPLRAHRLPAPAALPSPASADWRPTQLPIDLLLKPHLKFEFFASLELPGVHPVRELPDGSTDAISSGDPHAGPFALTHPDGSWARFRNHGDTLETAQGGPRGLWDLAERALVLWNSLGRPERDRFGLTVDGSRQEFWLDEPDGLQWELS
ncbi:MULTISPECIES: methyltransferase domain-containing protein [unclassified Amycolatopsis]|uniref:methyltransferase domain-containing protein n=1 Tax=unclassified Amycolatopsis TaxID=2618356 RepID=UPI001C696E23|nr:methyltransferase domain-containing protein [Amycolatopsis sp. DSM 110486]QYN24669.1 methyltransferase domain-containing protein [Amycolatopsis sp. DSM 110486]